MIELTKASQFTVLLFFTELKSTGVHRSAVIETNSYQQVDDWLYNCIVVESAETYKWKTELEFSKVLLTHSTIFGRVVTNINNIFKAVVKDNATNIDVRS